ncbi:MAG: DUF6625 family protein [bacterium]
MKKICLINFYAGKFPNYFNFFLESCRKNPTVNFIIFNDQLKEDRKIDNVLLKRLSLREFEVIFTKKTGIQIKVERPYKKTDYKPVYGLLFEELIEGFDFWGYCDLDQIFGNIRKFITDEVLENNDVITTGEKWVAGHFTLFKNNEFFKRLFELSPSHRLIFQDSRNSWHFDETCKRWKGEFYTIEYLVDNKMLVSTYDVIRNLEKSGKLKAHFKDVIREHSIRRKVDYLYRDGKLVDLNNGEEFMYHHLIAIKYFWWFYIPSWKRIPDSYHITSRGIHSFSEKSGVGAILWKAQWGIYFLKGVFRSLIRWMKDWF